LQQLNLGTLRSLSGAFISTTQNSSIQLLARRPETPFSFLVSDWNWYTVPHGRSTNEERVGCRGKRMARDMQNADAEWVADLRSFAKIGWAQWVHYSEYLAANSILNISYVCSDIPERILKINRAQELMGICRRLVSPTAALNILRQSSTTEERSGQRLSFFELLKVRD
jgi:hypothetical protein